MSYTKITDFASKDALATGNPAKIITGTAHDNEYNAIQVADALNLKRDGTTTASANIPMGNNKLTGLAAGNTAGDSVRFEQFASPPAIGSTAPNTIAGTTVNGTTITASTQFTGPGTGVTGTAAGLSIGGNAVTSTTATNIAGGALGSIPYQSAAGETALLAAGASGLFLRSNGVAAPSWASVEFTRLSAVNTTSGTSVTLSTTIPSTATEIVILFSAVSTDGTSIPVIQVGSGSFSTSGYDSGVTFNSGGSAGATTVTSGFAVGGAIATDSRTGTMELMLFGGNVWISKSSVRAASGIVFSGAGFSPALGGALDRVRISTNLGVDNFDAGSIVLLYR